MNTTAQNLTTYSRYCTACACADACRSAFGAFWPDRSGGGVGCNKPFDGNADAPLPPPAHSKDMTPDEEWAWFEEYLRRKAVNRKRFDGWSPRELETAVMMKYPGRFMRRFT